MPKPERRTLFGNHARLENRSAGEKPSKLIVGHAAVFNQWTTLYETQYYRWREIVRPGAYANAISTRQEVMGLFNHDPNFILGCTSSGTVRLREDDIGLYDEIDPPDSQTILDLVVKPIERGDLKGQSIGFCICDDGTSTRVTNADGTVVVTTAGDRTTYSYDGEVLVEAREVLAADLFDVSIVTYPAFKGTDAALRSASLGLDLEARLKLHNHPHNSPSKRAALKDAVTRRLRLAEAQSH